MIIVIALISSIIYVAPIDSARMNFGQQSDSASVALFKHKNLLDKPLLTQVFIYLQDISPLCVLHKNNSRLRYYQYVDIFSIGGYKLLLKKPYLRQSFVSAAPVEEMLKTAIPKTIILGISALLISIVFGLSFGALGALYYGSALDQWLLTLSTMIYAVPSYIAAIIFSIVFGYALASFTGLSVQGSIIELNDFGDTVFVWSNLVLPALALGIRPISQLFQMTRAAILDVMHQDFVRTAKAKGISPWSIMIKHIFPNALNPILTTISSWFASMLTGAFFVEYVFNFRGLGDLSIQALNQFDIPVIMACCSFTVLLFIIINISTDILYSVIDPRIRI